MIKAVLFDMDGVLVDSEEFICKAAIEMFREKGLMVKPEDFIPFVGTGENRYIGGVAEKYNFPLVIERDKKRTYEIYEQIVHNKLKPLPGVLDFITSCRNKNLKIAVATSADEVKMKINLREIGIPVEAFDATVNGLQIERKKPFPDIYLKAAELLGVEPEKCLVVEDAPNGIQAARAAGMNCLAVMSSFKEIKLKDADWIVKDLTFVPEEVLIW
jgi:beta-phosphoglucomutase